MNSESGTAAHTPVSPHILGSRISEEISSRKVRTKEMKAEILPLFRAVKKLDAINFEALNRAIEDLADIVEPLANISNFFG